MAAERAARADCGAAAAWPFESHIWAGGALKTGLPSASAATRPPSVLPLTWS
ncbi:hypothetical protein ACFWHQ_34400 [Streptomyces sp. NPDC060334]|uniref:hypothetical protein n=1 Tax=Streptomyces sp. NPDC060334 TaxID=3347099 RepID=UPI00365BFD6C